MREIIWIAKWNYRSSTAKSSSQPLLYQKEAVWSLQRKRITDIIRLFFSSWEEGVQPCLYSTLAAIPWFAGKSPYCPHLHTLVQSLQHFWWAWTIFPSDEVKLETLLWKHIPSTAKDIRVQNQQLVLWKVSDHKG